MGIELEVNQIFFQSRAVEKMDKLFQVLFSGLPQTIENMP